MLDITPDIPIVAWIASGAALFVAGCLAGHGFAIYKMAHGRLEAWLGADGRVRYRKLQVPRRAAAAVAQPAATGTPTDKPAVVVDASVVELHGRPAGAARITGARASARARSYKARPRRSLRRKIP